MQIRKTLGRLLAVAGMFGLYVVAQGVAMLPGLASKGQASPWLTVVAFGIAFVGLSLLLSATYRYFLRNEPPNGYGLHRPTFTTWRFVAFMVLALVGVQALNTLAISTKIMAESTNQVALQQLMNQTPTATLLIIVLGAPPVEEYIFRALLMHSFPYQDTRYGVLIAGIISAVVFGLAHADFSEPLNWLTYTLMGGVFVATYAYTKDIRYSIGLHMLNNFAALFI